VCAGSSPAKGGNTIATIWGLFTSLADARGTVTELLRQGFQRDEVSVLLQAQIARRRRGRTSGTPGGGEKGGGELHPGLAEQQPVAVADTGPLLAAGSFAVAVTHAAVQKGGLQGALAVTGVPLPFARAYRDGVRKGHVLVGLQASGQRERTAVAIMRRHRVVQLAGLPESTTKPASGPG
jgi:hypothetical protein